MDADFLEMFIDNVELGMNRVQSFLPMKMNTSRGSVNARYYHAPQAKHAVIWVGTDQGGFDTPAYNLYPRLAEELTLRHISSLQVEYRHADDLLEATLDVLGAIAFLNSIGLRSLAVVGHGFGGSVVMQAAALSDTIHSIITLSTDVQGAEAAALLQSKPLLLIHGMDDKVLPPEGSAYAHDIATGYRKLVYYPAAGHELLEASPQVYTEVKSWLLTTLQKH